MTSTASEDQGADLAGIGDGEIILGSVQTEGLANGATEFRPIEVQGCNLGDGEGERGASGRFAEAERGNGRLRSGSSGADNTVSTAEIPWAGKGSQGGAFLLWNCDSGGYKLIPEMRAANCGSV